MSRRARVALAPDARFPPNGRARFMSIATRKRTFQRVCDAYNSGPGAIGVGPAEPFTDYQLPVDGSVCAFRNSENAEFYAAVVGKLRLILAEGNKRPVTPTIGRTVLQIRIVRFGLYCGWDVATYFGK